MKIFSITYIDNADNQVLDWTETRKEADRLVLVWEKFHDPDDLEPVIRQYELPSRPTRGQLVTFLNNYARGEVF